MLRRLQQTNKSFECDDVINMYGKCVKYGSLVRLLHLKSDKNLSICKQIHSTYDPNAFKTYFDNIENEGLLFYIMPLNKLRSIGEDITVGDEVVFKSALANPKSLSVSQRSQCLKCNDILENLTIFNSQ